MNRIILIGNGFDLAHGLETSYRSFVDNFWKNIGVEFNNYTGERGTYLDNDFLSIGPLYSKPRELFQNYNSLTNWLSLRSNRDAGTFIRFKNLFLKQITEKHSLEKWVDVEEEYHQEIKSIIQKTSRYSRISREITPIEKLNEDFEKIKQALENYLSEITNNPPKIKGIHDLFFDSIKRKDIASSKEEVFVELISEMLYSSDPFYRAGDFYNSQRDSLFKEMTEEYKIKDSDVGVALDNFLKTQKPNYFNDDEVSHKIFPRRTLILNFNYTKTESLYSDYKDYKGNEPDCWFPPFFPIQPTIHIHGELNSETNPIVFGYGDEKAEEYKEIEKLNDNEFLRNIKSIKYLQTANYKRLLDFADSDFFQIYVFGHSCGNSDRTLLSRLFEHKNCVSIKPFFYEKEANGQKINDYEDVTINMSRNFDNKSMFREKVVNKAYCTPLPQKPK
ncbi:MAG: bacteriophage abortive infection AbiH family protein [Bacteroidales bacterium]|nr:bacteriophage abortive infection AbiH family protein [Bacteroidales bacterium]